MAGTLQLGSAGAALRTDAAAAALADLLTEWAPTEEELKTATTAGLAALDEEAKEAATTAISAVTEAIENLFGENAAEILENCGYTPMAEGWNAEALRPLAAAIREQIEEE